jgi:hypothetical protein
MEIPFDARKCPHCHHFQNRLVLLLYHPAFAVLFMVVPMSVLFIWGATIFDRGESYEEYKDQIVISESEMAFGETKANETVSVIGAIKNTSGIPWKQIHFQADFLDESGKRIDAGQKEEYSFYLPANGETSFKVSFRREFPETRYVKHSIRVLAAKDARARW